METVEFGRPEVRSGANFQNPVELFKAIDEYIRSYDKQWVTVASMCLEVKAGSLWKHGSYHSWEDWVNKAAPKSARSIFSHVGVLTDLSPDFSMAELAAMRPEVAKAMRKLSKVARRDARVRSAASGKPRREFVKVVNETHPLEHLEDETKVSFEASDFVEIEEIVEGYRLLESDPDIPLAKAIFAILEDWKQTNL